MFLKELSLFLFRRWKAIKQIAFVSTVREMKTFVIKLILNSQLRERYIPFQY